MLRFCLRKSVNLLFSHLKPKTQAKLMLNLTPDLVTSRKWRTPPPSASSTHIKLKELKYAESECDKWLSLIVSGWMIIFFLLFYSKWDFTIPSLWCVLYAQMYIIYIIRLLISFRRYLYFISWWLSTCSSCCWKVYFKGRTFFASFFAFVIHSPLHLQHGRAANPEYHDPTYIMALT